MSEERQIATYRDQRKHRKLVGQVTAVKWLHTEVDGVCAHCALPAPCPTREVMGLGAKTAAPFRLREQAWKTLRAKVAEVLGIPEAPTTTTEGTE